MLDGNWLACPLLLDLMLMFLKWPVGTSPTIWIFYLVNFPTTLLWTTGICCTAGLLVFAVIESRASDYLPPATTIYRPLPLGPMLDSLDSACMLHRGSTELASSW